jgi:GNAT superfamily N-acetyltransferase
VLKELYVRPEFQRKGLGSRLVKWGVEKADEIGLPAYTEGSTKGMQLYLSYGFKEVDRVTVDLEKWGGSKGEFHSYGLLFREARKSKSH